VLNLKHSSRLTDMLSVDRDADATVTTGIRSGWFKFRSGEAAFLTCYLEKFMTHVYRVVCYMKVRHGL